MQLQLVQLMYTEESDRQDNMVVGPVEYDSVSATLGLPRKLQGDPHSGVERRKTQGFKYVFQMHVAMLQ
jgi:hypothetical protein